MELATLFDSSFRQVDHLIHLHDELFIAFYRWKLKSGKEERFRAAWTKVILAIRKKRGSLDSRLHKGDDGTWAAYAQWPSNELWQADCDHDHETNIARQKMRKAVEEHLPDLYLSRTRILPVVQLMGMGANPSWTRDE